MDVSHPNTMLTGAQIFLELLHRSGVKYLFGNPGSTELPLMDAMASETRVRYILGLQEIPVMGMAEGYAVAARKPGVVNLHIACGLGNAMGMLYNAWCAGSPLVVTAGQQDRRLRAQEPVLEGDLVAVARPWTKWATEVQRAEDLAGTLRRAIQTALTPPTGPVFLSLPVDVQSECVAEADLRPPSPPDCGQRPGKAAIEEAAKLLALADRPVILAGCRAAESGAFAEVARLAEILGAPVYSEVPTSAGRLPIDPAHPLYAGRLPYWSDGIQAELAQYDVALAAGMTVFRLYIHHEPECPIPPRVRLVQLDNDPGQVGKNYPVEAGLVGDPKAGLAELAEAVLSKRTQNEARRADERRQDLIAKAAVRREQLQAELDGARGRRPMTAMTLMETIGTALPEDGVFVDEAPTANQNVLARMGLPRDPAAHFAHRGWGLGWGMGFALGVKLAWPDRPVAALLGDGASLYGIQGLWTAARYRIPVTFVVANNAQYKILKICGDVMKLPRMCAGDYVGMDLTQPHVNYVKLAESFGVAAWRISEPDELAERLRAGLAGDRPVLLDVVIER